MTRPSDWSPVGLDADPTPGDPVLVLSGGQEYLEVAESIDNAASSMSRLDVDGTISQAVDALMATKEDTVGEIRKAHGRYVAAGEALVGYASSLERVQSETLTALDRARDAQDQVQAASGSKDRWQDLADGAKDEAEKAEYEQKAQQAGGDADQAAGIISSAKSSVESAVSDRDRAAEHAIDRIEEITSSDDLNDSWWDDWGSKLVAAIADIADMISTIAGILAIIVAFIPVVGTALAGVLIVIAAVAAIVSAVANITLAATGERSWAEAGLAIAGAALSLIGLGAAAKAATGLAKGISKGGLRSGKNCKFGFGQCFVAGTLIRTAEGERPIEEIRVGDKVWAHNLAAGADELQVVVETFVRTTTELFHLTINGQRVSTTAEHPFMVHGRGWIDAAFLKAGDLLVTPEGTTVPLDAIETEQRDDAETVYNFHVETHSNYYVHAGDTPVLVHNAGHSRDELCDISKLKGDEPDTARRLMETPGWDGGQLKGYVDTNNPDFVDELGRTYDAVGGPRAWTHPGWTHNAAKQTDNMHASIEAHHYLKSGFDFTVLDFAGASPAQVEAAMSHLAELAASGRTPLNELITLGR